MFSIDEETERLILPETVMVMVLLVDPSVDSHQYSPLSHVSMWLLAQEEPADIPQTPHSVLISMLVFLITVHPSEASSHLRETGSSLNT